MKEVQDVTVGFVYTLKNEYFCCLYIDLYFLKENTNAISYMRKEPSLTLIDCSSLFTSWTSFE